MYFAQYDEAGKQIVALLTVEQYLELPKLTITEACGPLSLIKGEK
jgi:hypothetical protein